MNFTNYTSETQFSTNVSHFQDIVRDKRHKSFVGEVILVSKWRILSLSSLSNRYKRGARSSLLIELNIYSLNNAIVPITMRRTSTISVILSPNRYRAVSRWSSLIISSFSSVYCNWTPRIVVWC